MQMMKKWMKIKILSFLLIIVGLSFSCQGEDNSEQKNLDRWLSQAQAPVAVVGHMLGSKGFSDICVTKLRDAKGQFYTTLDISLFGSHVGDIIKP
jgi:hypothetical protein